jgi:hypothetical protein
MKNEGYNVHVPPKIYIVKSVFDYQMQKFRQLHWWRPAVNRQKSFITEGLTRMESLLTSEGIMLWDGILQIVWTKDKLCVAYALVYSKGHKTKKWGSWHW